MKNEQIALNTATSATLSNRKITFGGTDVASPVIDFLSSKAPVNVKTYSPEVLGSATISFTAANNTTYSFVVKQVVNDNEVVIPFTYTSDATGTEAEIDAAFKAALDILIASGALKVSVNVSGSSTIVITALAGYPLLQVIPGKNVTVGSVIIGQKAVNDGADLVDAGVENAVAGNTYTSFEFLTSELSLGAGQETETWKKLTVYIKTGETAISQLNTILQAAAFDSGQVELI